jgi:hypothetical protein
MFDLIVSLVILAAIALLVGAFVLYHKGVTKQALLMGVLAFVMIANAAIWLVPTADGGSLADTAARTGEE